MSRRTALSSVLLLAALAVPAGGPLDGLPVTSAGGLALALVAASPILSTRVRTQLRRLLPRRWPALLPLLLLLVLSGRLLVALALPPEGFAACYSGRFDPPDAAPCAPLYGDLLHREAVSRHDEVLLFGSEADPMVPSVGLQDSTWNLSLVNSLRYNYLRPEQPRRDRLSLSASWRGRVPATDVVRVQYVGAGEVRTGDRTIRLPRSYRQPGVVEIADVSGEFAIDLEYRDTRTASPYASLVVTTSDGEPLRTTDSHAWLRTVLSLLLAVALAAVALALLRALSPWQPLASWSLPLLGLGAVGAGTLGGLPWLPLVVGAGTVVVLAAARQRAAAGGLSLVAVGAGLAHGIGHAVGAGGPRLYRTVYRAGGDDFLTYESYARDVLESGSLRGGEDVFVYSPGFRYLVHLLHLLLGDGDHLQWVVYLTLVVAGCWWAWYRLARFAGLGVPAVLPLAALLVLAVMAFTEPVARGALVLLSEYPTWLCLLFGFPLALTAARRRDLVVLSLLTGLALVLRIEQAPGLLLVWALGAWRVARPAGAWRPALRVLAPSAVVLVGLLSLPTLHNLYYGGELALLPQTPRLPVNFPLPPAQIPSVLASGDPQGVLREQVAGVLVLPELTSSAAVSIEYLTSVRLVQAAWLVSLVWVLTSAARRRRLLLPLLVPVVLLAPHVLIQVYVYYPRHVVIGYLAAAVAVLAVACDAASSTRGRDAGPQAQEPDSQRSPASGSLTYSRTERTT